MKLVDPNTSIASIIKNWLIPLLVALFTAGVTYSSISMRLDFLTTDVGNLESKVEASEVEDEQNNILILQRMTAIETKVDYIYDWVKGVKAN